MNGSTASRSAPFLAAAALALAAFAAAWVHRSPTAALTAWALAGALLASAGPAQAGAATAPRRHPREAWELPVLGVFLVGAVWLRVHGLREAPPGVTFPELAAINKAHELGAYTPHAVDFHVGWPTLVFYIGLVFEKLGGGLYLPFRAVSAVWGALAFVAMVLALRAWLGPKVALVAGLLAAFSNLDLSVSRLYYSSTVLLFSFAGALYFFVRGLRDGRLRWWALAGFCAGLMLHGYFPGRIGAPLLTAWVLWAARDPSGRRLRAWGAYAAGFLLCAGPVLVWAVLHSQEYWGHIKDMRPNGGGLRGLWESVRGLVPLYLGHFHLYSDGRPSTDDGLPLIPLLGPDWVSQALFPLGFFAALFTPARPLALLTAGAAVAGLLPGLLGSGFPHPTSRRVVLVLPAVAMASAYALGLLGSALGPRLGRLKSAWWAVALVAAAAAASSYRSYFHDLMGSTKVKIQWNYGLVLADRAFGERPTALPVVGAELYHPVESYLLMARKPRTAEQPEDYLLAGLDGDAVMAMDVNFQSLLPDWQRRFKGFEYEAVRHEPVELFDNRQDPSDPDAWFVKAFMPAEGRRAFSGLARAGGEGPYRPDPGPARLAGVLLVPAGAGPVTLVPAAGWRLRANGRPVAAGAGVGGGEFRSVFVEAEGTVRDGQAPLSAKGRDGRELYPEAFLPLGAPHGWAVHVDGIEQKGSQDLGWDLFPPRRVFDNAGQPMQQWRTMRARLTPDVDGPVQIIFANGEMRWQVRVDGRLVGDFDGSRPAVPEAVTLKAGRPMDLEVRVLVPWGIPRIRVLPVRWAPVGSADFKDIPLGWLQPAGR